jgi:hypothetical protein
VDFFPGQQGGKMLVELQDWGRAIYGTNGPFEVI